MLRELDVSLRGPAKVVDDVTTLAIVPPAQKLDLDAAGAERGRSLLDLDLEPAMRERKRGWMIKKNAHLQFAARFVRATG